MIRVIKLGLANQIGTSKQTTDETRVTRDVQPLQSMLLSGIGYAEKGNKWWAWKDLNLRPADYETRRPCRQPH